MKIQKKRFSTQYLTVTWLFGVKTETQRSNAMKINSFYSNRTGMRQKPLIAEAITTLLFENRNKEVFGPT